MPNSSKRLDGDGIRIEAAAYRLEDLLPAGGEHQQLVIDLSDLGRHHRVAAVQEKAAER